MAEMHRNGRPVRVAAAGDIHADESRRADVAEAFARVEEEADLVLLAGDLTTHGEPEQAQVLADACRGLSIPVVGVLGNHDWHANRRDEVVEVCRDAGICMLDRSSTIVDVHGVEIGIAGAKGFVGGFPDSRLPDFGEPLLRQVYAYTTAEVEGIERGLREIDACPLRILLMHYAPTMSTLEGEPRTIWTYLGSDRLAEPIEQYRPDLVLHGHAHRGTFEGFVGAVPVYNVAVHVTQRDFWIFELEPGARAPAVESAAPAERRAE
jgi:Icc-related predicted phosphoesterase